MNDQSSKQVKGYIEKKRNRDEYSSDHKQEYIKTSDDKYDKSK